MKVWNPQWKKIDTLIEALALDVEKHRRIGVVGGGGKTTLMYRLAAEMVRAGKRVILTTTTHMWKSTAVPFVCDCDREEMEVCLAEEQMVLTGWQDPQHPDKIAGVTTEDLSCFLKMADVVLVEADGAKQRPLKAPADWEPVGTEWCDVVIGVGGIDAVAQSFQNACHRPEQAASLVGKKTDELITEEDLAKILCSPQGGRKQVTGEYRILVNKVDSDKDRIRAKRLGAVFEAWGIHAAYSSLREEIAMILLAAGNSTRFQGNKLLHLVQGKPMYRHMIERSGELSVKQRILVTQYEEIVRELEGEKNAPEKADRLADSPLQVVRNPHPEWGISHSIRLGIEAAGEADAYLFAVCDQPYLRRETLQALCDTYQNSPRGIAALHCGEQSGNPNLFSSSYKDDLCALRGDVGGKSVLRKHLEDVAWVPVRDARELRDVDEREQLEEA